MSAADDRVRVTGEDLAAAIDNFGAKALAVADDRARLRAWLHRIEEHCAACAITPPADEGADPNDIRDACLSALRGETAPKGPGL